jgi:cyclic-di-GMP-binding protein
MPSFDIVSKVDLQTLDNAINTAKKEIINRYDFRGSKTEIELDKKNYVVHLLTEDDMKVKAVQDIIMQRAAKQGIDPQSMDFGKEHYASGNMVKKDIKVKQGIDKEIGKKIVKLIKDTKLKVEPSIMDDQVRVSAKKIDDLQAVMAMLRKSEVGIPLQFVNIK